MNYIKKVCEMLGVEIGEEFKVITPNGDYTDTLFKFTDTELVYGENVSTPIILGKLMMGRYKISKLPWFPKEDEAYYIPDIRFPNKKSDIDFQYSRFGGRDKESTKVHMEYNMGFKTTDEAVKRTEEILNILKALEHEKYGAILKNIIKNINNICNIYEEEHSGMAYQANLVPIGVTRKIYRIETQGYEYEK